MKKLTGIFALTLVICVLLALITSCKVEDRTNDPSDVTGTENASVTESQESGTAETEGPVEHGITIEETVLVDEKGVKITALSLDPYDPLKINISIENNSGKDLKISTAETEFGGLYNYVNDYSVRAWIDEQKNLISVKNSEKSYNVLNFDIWDEMKKYIMKDGIVADFEMAFRVTDFEGDETEYWDTVDYWQTEQIKIKTSAADTYDYSFDDSGVLLYDDKDIKIVFKEIYDDGFPSVLFTVDNNSDKNIKVIVDDFITDINGCTAAPCLKSFYPWFARGKNSVGVYRFLDFNREPSEQSDYELFKYDRNIESIKSLTTNFLIHDLNVDPGGDYHYGQTGPITLNFDWQDGIPTVTLVTDDAK